VTELENDTFLRALRRRPVDYTPVWIMRQAGRYLPEYRATRARAGSFMGLCRNPELACEVTLQPLDRFDLDAAILFSDILTIPDAMGLGLYFTEGEGPRFERPIRDASDVRRLAVPDMEDELGYVMDAVGLIRRELAGRVPLIGFAGSPWTLAVYMIEGGGTKSFARSKAMLFGRPELMHALLTKLAAAVTAYLEAQIARGAQALMIFDTWGGTLTPRDYREFSLEYMMRIVAGLTREEGVACGDIRRGPGMERFPDSPVAKPRDGLLRYPHESQERRVPIILFTKGGGRWLDRMAESGCDALGVDWTQDLADARSLVKDRVALQGNLDPGILYASPERIREEVGRVLASYGQGPGHIFNLGHGIHPDAEPDHVATLVDAVHTLSPAFHGAGE